MRILVTNDDGVFAPGIAALARGLWQTFGDEHEIVVVAPLVDHSGAGAAVGAVVATRGGSFSPTPTQPTPPPVISISPGTGTVGPPQ